ncbi:transmembrane protein [Mycobacteroides abscessus subsp. abscessus]|nr:transmembrane protein [Mycobacteroides abscessus subsp. abscessus]
MSTPTAIQIAITFIWLGMVFAISFLEAPLKFRAPNVTLQIGLGIGRLVFRVLNTVELVFAAVIVLTALMNRSSLTVMVAFVVAVAALAVQLVVVRPRLNRRSDEVLAGRDGQRSRMHHAYVVLESIKVVALLVAGISLL